MPPYAAHPTDGVDRSEADTWVVCLCAEWCGVCRDYRAIFDQLTSDYPKTRFVWVDVEDEEDLAGDVDVNTFPTVLLGARGRARFLGPLLPHAGVLKRLLESVESADGTEAGPAAQALFARVMASRS